MYKTIFLARFEPGFFMRISFTNKTYTQLRKGRKVMVSAAAKESVFAMMGRLRGMDDYDYLRYLVAYQAAPTIGGFKPATLICPSGPGRQYRRNWSRCRRTLPRSLGVGLADLRVADDALMLLVYKPELLGRTLGDREALDLLAEMGYDTSGPGIDPLLERLRERCARTCCPHEIGLFLGYPPDDVRGFMLHGGKRSKATGCWKAYSNVERAECYFTRCQRAKSLAAKLIGEGWPFEKVADSLRDGKCFLGMY